MSRSLARSLRHALGSFALAAVLAFTAGPAHAQATYTWIAPTSASWSTATNWSPTRTSPATDDVLVFDGSVGSANMVLDVSTETIGRLRLQNGASVSLSALPAGSILLQLGGGTGDDLAVPAGCALQVQGGGVSFELRLGANATGLVSGELSLSGVDTRLTATDTDGLTIASGAVVTCSSAAPPFGTSDLNSVRFLSGSTCVADGTGDVFGAVAPAAVVAFEPGSLYRLTATTPPAMSGRTFANVEVDSPGLSATAATGALPCTMDDLTLTAGVLRLHVVDVHVHGDLTLQGGSVLFDPSGTQDLWLDGTAPQALELVSGNWTFGTNTHLHIANPAGVTLVNGTLAPSSATIEASGSLTLGAGPGALLQNAGAFAVYGTLRLGALSAPPTGALFLYHPGSHLVLANSTHIGVSSPVWWPEGLNGPTNVSLLGSGGIEFLDPANHTITGTLLLSAGVLDVGNGVLDVGPSGLVIGGSAASHVKGTLRKLVPTSVGPRSCTFEIGDGLVYAPVVVAFPSVSSGGTLGASTTAGDHPSIASSAIDAARSTNRYWTLDAAGMTYGYATATFAFAPGDIDAGADPTTFGAARYLSSSTWASTNLQSAQPTQLTLQGLADLTGDYQLGHVLTCLPSLSLLRTDFPAGTAPYALDIADLDGNGTLDIATSNYSSSTVSVLSGSGSGSFSLAQTYAAAAAPVSMAIGDVNADSRPDLVVANWIGGLVTEYLSTGNLNFAAATSVRPFYGATAPISARLGNLNGDPYPDLFFVTYSPGGGVLLTGDPSGTFNAPTTTTLPTGAYDAALGDLDGDGDLDAVVAIRTYSAPYLLAVRLNDGAGGFTSAPSVAVGAQPTAVALGDLNGDGHLDVVSVNEAEQTISVLMGNGLGGFGSRVDRNTGSAPFDAAIGDLNGDGWPEIVVVNGSGSSVSVFVANCEGGYLPRVDIPVGSAPRQVAIADVDDNGFADVIVTNASSNTVSVLLNTLGTPYVSNTIFRGRVLTAEGGAQLQNEGELRVRLSNLNPSGEGGVRIQATSSSTPAAVTFSDGGLPIAGDGLLNWVRVSLDGRVGQAQRSLGGMRLQVTPAALELSTDFSNVGATHQRIELYDGATRVHSCDMPNNTLVTRPPVSTASQGARGDAGPLNANAAGDGIGGVEVGLKKKPGGQIMLGTMTFTTLRPTTVGSTTVNADRVVVSAYAPLQPLSFDATLLHVSAPYSAPNTSVVSIGAVPDVASDTTWQVAGLAVRRAGAASVTPGTDDLLLANLGSSGMDGVEFDLTYSDGAVLAFAPGQGFQTARDAGAQLVHTVSGIVGCADDQLVGTLTESAYSDSITVRSDFAAIGATQVTIELLNNGSVVHTGVYAASQGVALVAPPAGPGQSAQAASINTSRSNIKDKASLATGNKPRVIIIWDSDGTAYRLKLGSSAYVGNEVRFTAVDGLPVTKLTSATIRQKNPGVPQLDSLRLERPGLLLGASDFSVRPSGSYRVMAPDSGRTVIHACCLGSSGQDGVSIVKAPALEPRLSVRTIPPGASAMAPTAQVVVRANGLTAASAAASTPAVTIARSGAGFALSPRAGLLALRQGAQSAPTSASSGNWRLQVLSGAVVMAEEVGASPEALAATFPDRVGVEAVGGTTEARWDAPLSITVTGGPTVSGDRVRLTPLSPPEALAQLSELVLESTDLDYLELSDPDATATTDVTPGAMPGTVALAVQRNPVRGGGPVGFAVQLPSAQSARLELFDLLGRRVATLHDGVMRAGVTQLSWDASAHGAGSGVMLARLVTAAGTRTQKFVIIH